MHDLPHRAALAVLVLAGCLTGLSPLASGGLHDTQFPALLALWHRQLLLGVLGAGLVLAVVVPALRPAALGAAILSKAGYLAIWLATAAPLTASQWLEAGLLALLLGASAVFGAEAWRQARWDGVLPLCRVSPSEA
jgi:hypothetical protein